jgi:hypothetical protein
MPPGTAAIAPRPLNVRARSTNRPQKMVIDGRTELGRRVRDLAEGFARRLGGWAALSDTLAANVRRAAELSALAEQMRAEALRNGNLDPLGMVRLEGAARRAVRELQLDRNRDLSGMQVRPAPYAIGGHRNEPDSDPGTVTDVAMAADEAPGVDMVRKPEDGS